VGGLRYLGSYLLRNCHLGPVPTINLLTNPSKIMKFLSIESNESLLWFTSTHHVATSEGSYNTRRYPQQTLLHINPPYIGVFEASTARHSGCMNHLTATSLSEVGHQLLDIDSTCSRKSCHRTFLRPLCPSRIGFICIYRRAKQLSYIASTLVLDY
jgi:hypothetical protein